MTAVSGYVPEAHFVDCQPKARPKDIALGREFVLLCLFHVPAELADGFGLKEPPYLGYTENSPPAEWFLRSPAGDSAIRFSIVE